MSKIRKTRKDKEKARIREIKRELAQLDKLDAELNKKKTKAIEKAMKFCNLDSFLKSTAIITLVVSFGAVAALGVGTLCMLSERDKYADESAEDYMMSEEYEEIKSQCIEEYYQSYKQGEITSNELVEKIDSLHSVDFVKDELLTDLNEKAEATFQDQKRKLLSVTLAIESVMLPISGVSYGVGKLIDRKSDEYDFEAGKCDKQLSDNMRERKKKQRELELTN